ncbi:polysaccharide deacetylase family protein [Kitasatospora sp. NPDC050543]|uniref:polysaccharide deacetylase family protein n=1 Tax=Kitasatospora sp. NPDC050543 TaxID=3364054 RepID=UPI00378B1AF3
MGVRGGIAGVAAALLLTLGPGAAAAPAQRWDIRASGPPLPVTRCNVAQPTTAPAVPTDRRPACPGAAAGLRAAPDDADPDCEPVNRLFGGEIRRIPTEEPLVALTFNAAWNEDGLAVVLAELRRQHAPATFFLTGEFADGHPAAVRAIAAEHGVANHSYDHPELADLTPDDLRAQVLDTDRAIRRAAGAVPLPFYRFPFSDTTPDAIAEVNALGYADIEFTQDTKGYLGLDGGMTVDKAVQRAVDALRPGMILQMHLGTGADPGPNLDAQALPRIVEAIHARGYRITDLRALLDEPASGCSGA